MNREILPPKLFDNGVLLTNYEQQTLKWLSKSPLGFKETADVRYLPARHGDENDSLEHSPADYFHIYALQSLFVEIFSLVHVGLVVFEEIQAFFEICQLRL